MSQEPRGPEPEEPAGREEHVVPPVEPEAAPTDVAPTRPPKAAAFAEPARRRTVTALPGRVWTRLRSRAADAVIEQPTPATTPVSVVVPPPPIEREAPLLRQSPFAFGFFGAVGALVAIWLFQNLASLSNIILIVVVSLFLALGLNPMVEGLSRRLRLKRWIAVTLVALAAIAVVTLGSWALVPLIADQVNTLISQMPSYVQQLRSNPTIARFDEKYQVLAKLNEAVASPGTWTNMFGGVLGAGKLLANAMVSLVIGLVLTIYFLSSLPQIKNVIYQLAPKSRRPRVQYLANEMFRRIGGYLTGLFIVMTCAATAAFIMLNIVGLGKYAFALAFIVGLLAAVPLVGPPISMTINVLVALAVAKPVTALIVLIFFLCYQQVEAYALTPRVMQRSVNVPGAIVVVAAFAGGSLLGVIGALIAVPTAAALLLLYREVLVPQLDRS